MKFSIVTPSFNQVEFICDTIDSVLAQRNAEIEYIVVDGGSVDGTAEILRSYESLLSRVIIESDDGQADAINKGFSFASGDIFSYLNSDDYYFKNTLELVEEYFRENPEVDMIYGDCVFTDEKGQFIRYFSEISDFDSDRLLNFSDHIMQPATFWRRRVFEKYGPFDANLHYGFDWAFWCELSKNGCHIERVPHILAANRVYEETKTLSGSHERLKELKNINRRYKTRLLSHAYYRYYLSDLTKKRQRRLLDYVLLPWLVVMSYGNIINHFKNFDKKIIFGFYPKSPYVAKKAYIKMPRLNYRSICLRLKTNINIEQAVVIHSNGKLINEYQFVDGLVVVEFELNESVDIDISLEFYSEYSKSNNLLSRFFYFYQPNFVAAEVLSITTS